MQEQNLVKYLQRDDKWYLGSGEKLIWAPPYPQYLERPGFWDPAHFHHYTLGPVFTFHLVDESGVELPLQLQKRTWQPDGITKIFAVASRLKVIERQSLFQQDVLISKILLRNRSDVPTPVHFVLWTAVPANALPPGTLESGIQFEKSWFRYNYRCQGYDGAMLDLVIHFGLKSEPDSYSVVLARNLPNFPNWEFTPFFDLFQAGQLNNQIILRPVDQEGLVYLALAQKIILAPHEERKIQAQASFAESEPESRQHFLQALKPAPRQSSRQTWRKFFDAVPHLSCSDPWFEKYYWYSWYGFRLSSQPGQNKIQCYPAVYEGLDYFRVLISYSAFCHVRVARWLASPRLAQGSILNFVQNQRADGSFPGRIYHHSPCPKQFYHADWGEALFQLELTHPDLRYLNEVYPAMVRYVDYFDRERDREHCGLYDVVDQHETGQEFMSRYLAVDPDADMHHYDNRLRLKGIDATTYIYRLKQWLATAAQRLERNAEQEQWQQGAEKIKHAVLNYCWDPEPQFFFDVDPATMTRTNIKAAVGFYPYLTDLISSEHLPGFQQHLFNPREFWTPFPVPAAPVDDPNFQANPFWRNKRENCPWNGRVWPLLNCHIIEALAHVSYQFAPELKPRLVEFIEKFIRMLFLNGDPQRPALYEHYHPFSGKPSSYRGIDDYQHSWINDILLKYVAGIQPQPNGVIRIDPLPFQFEWLKLTNLNFQDHQLAIEFQQDQQRLWVDGRLRQQTQRGVMIEIKI